jgi:predicted nucleotidyltransferase
MRTTRDVAAVLFGRARRLILGWLLGHPDESFFLRQIARQTGLPIGSVQRELEALTAAGLLTRKTQGRQVYFQADRASPVFPELQSLFVKTAGVADAIRAGLGPLLDRIDLAFVYGSTARGEVRNQSDVDLMVIGSVTFGEVVDALGNTQGILGREINPTVYSPDEFRKKVRAGQHFLTSVLRTPLVFVTGTRNDLGRLGGEESLAGHTSDVEGGDHEPSGRRRSGSAGQPGRRPQR